MHKPAPLRAYALTTTSESKLNMMGNQESIHEIVVARTYARDEVRILVHRKNPLLVDPNWASKRELCARPVAFASSGARSAPQNREPGNTSGNSSTTQIGLGFA